MKKSGGKSGRRPNVSPGASREQIREAAQEQFAQRGFLATTIRSIADQARVDPALVMHFFGSKERLFESCVEWPFDPEEKIAAIVVDGSSAAGEALVRLFVQTWDAHDGRNPIVALLRTAMAQETSERLLRDFLQTELLMPLLTALGIDDPELRSALVASQLLGLGAARYLLRFDALARLPQEQVVAWVAPTVQRYLTQPLLDAGHAR